jgi:predicted protein tyrosine phosphatase
LRSNSWIDRESASGRDSYVSHLYSTVVLLQGASTPSVHAHAGRSQNIPADKPLNAAFCTQGRMNLLFVCSENRLRSPTGEEVFSTFEGVNAIGCGTNSDADTPVSGDLIQWADIIFVMEHSHKNKVSKKFKKLLKGKKLVCLDIPDEYERMDPILIRLMKNRVMRHLPATVSRNT